MLCQIINANKRSVVSKFSMRLKICCARTIVSLSHSATTGGILSRWYVWIFHPDFHRRMFTEFLNSPGICPPTPRLIVFFNFRPVCWCLQVNYRRHGNASFFGRFFLLFLGPHFKRFVSHSRAIKVRSWPDTICQSFKLSLLKCGKLSLAFDFEFELNGI